MMQNSQFHWRDSLVYELENSWIDLINLVGTCIEETALNPRLLHFELLSLRESISEAKESQDQEALEECLGKCKNLLVYLKALQSQNKRARETGLPFARQALKRLTERQAN